MQSWFKNFAWFTQGTSWYLFWRWRLPSSFDLPFGLSSESTQDEVYLWHISSQQWVLKSHESMMPLASVDHARNSDWLAVICSLCRWPSVHIHLACPWWWSHGLWIKCWALESCAECGKNPPLCCQYVSRWDYWPSRTPLEHPLLLWELIFVPPPLSPVLPLIIELFHLWSKK